MEPTTCSEVPAWDECRSGLQSSIFTTYKVHSLNTNQPLGSLTTPVRRTERTLTMSQTPGSEQSGGHVTAATALTEGNRQPSQSPHKGQEVPPPWGRQDAFHLTGGDTEAEGGCMTSQPHHSHTTGLVPCPRPDPVAGHRVPREHRQETLCEAGGGRGPPGRGEAGPPHWPQRPRAAPPAETL